ncbi:MAG TPA: carbohydrate ABC transporter permease [Aggregatilinea sp.]|uniref:carbohydrate ABC transporter permease n=1 Tax=Aggregatilinea sp. TaxID=2806333 RepID=UPI002C183FE8|nr:carbohydrate ABC transporter permease [Aggregatilinea sp.]HML21494.1 carbohydrate ABC transporter permease [Aggregatilinea sp.]
MSTQVSRRNAQQRVGHTLMWIAILLVTLIALYPFLWAIITSFKPQRDALESSLIPWVQFDPIMDNWKAELQTGGQENFNALKNSGIIALGATAVALTLGTSAGYGLARFRFRIGNRNLVSWFLSQRFLPPVATLIPFFLMLQRLDLFDTRLGMIIVNATFVMPFAVLITRDFFADLPKDLEEAALVDGASHRQVFLRVALPIAGPAIVAAGIICFTFAWNEFLFASVLTVRDAQPFTVKISSTGTVRGIHFGYVSTRLLMAVLPPLILSLFVQRYIVRGLTMGAVKG